MEKELELDVPLLRKAVEWVQTEAKRPVKESEWCQGEWRVFGRDMGRTCDTVYCVAGYVATVVGTKWVDYPSRDGSLYAGFFDSDDRSASVIARKALGLDADEARALFHGNNSAKRVLEIAREICENRGMELGL
jgi:hypothetical protein